VVGVPGDIVPTLDVMWRVPDEDIEGFIYAVANGELEGHLDTWPRLSLAT
jgi:hypothetical protein